MDGFREPQQARSREKLQRVLQAAEDVLATAGFEDFTMAAVAARASVSVGAIYRRFAGKEQLIAAVQDRILTQVEERLSARLSTADGCLAGVIEVYSHVLAEAMGDGGRFFPFLLHAGPQSEAEERGRRALAETQRLLLEAAEPHRAEILRSDPGMALDVIARTIVGACIHAVLRPDKLPGRPAVEAVRRPAQRYGGRLSDDARSLAGHEAPHVVGSPSEEDCRAATGPSAECPDRNAVSSEKMARLWRTHNVCRLSPLGSDPVGEGLDAGCRNGTRPDKPSGL